MDKIDFKKSLKNLYAPGTKDFSEVIVPKMTYLMIDGKGDPNTSMDYKVAVEALYALAYTIKFISKRELNKDYIVAPLEGLWSADKMEAYIARNKDDWQWTMMIMQPEWINKAIFDRAVETAKIKKHFAALPQVRFEDYDEGRCIQIMHIGSYDNEAPTLSRLHNEYMPSNGLGFNGRHHEIYLNDPRKTDVRKLKTILRQPVLSD